MDPTVNPWDDDGFNQGMTELKIWDDRGRV